MRKYSLIGGFLVSLLWLTPSFAEDAKLQAGKEFVERLYNTFEEIYVEGDPAEIKNQLIDHYYLHFDHRRISGFILGSYRRRLNENQQDTFGKLLPEYIFNLLSPQLEKYFSSEADSNNSFSIISAKKLKREDLLIAGQYNGNQQVNMNIRLRPNDDTLKVLDVEVAGISMLLTQRDIIGGLLKKHSGDFDAFIAEMTQITENSQA